jgi:hypothetical protein
VVVIFTLLDKRRYFIFLNFIFLIELFILLLAAFYGPVEHKPDDLPLGNASKLLSVAIAVNRFTVPFDVSTNEVS